MNPIDQTLQQAAKQHLRVRATFADGSQLIGLVGWDLSKGDDNCHAVIDHRWCGADSKVPEFKVVDVEILAPNGTPVHELTPAQLADEIRAGHPDALVTVKDNVVVCRFPNVEKLLRFTGEKAYGPGLAWLTEQWGPSEWSPPPAMSRTQVYLVTRVQQIHQVVDLLRDSQPR